MRRGLEGGGTDGGLVAVCFCPPVPLGYNEAMLKLNDLREEIAALGEMAARRRRERQVEVERLLRWWEEAPDAEEARARLPGDSPVPQGEGPLHRLVEGGGMMPEPETVVIGVDGSQIVPDRHAAICYYLLQVGGLRFRYDGSRPVARQHATLHYREEELYDADGFLIGARQVGMRRTVAELDFLLALVEEAAEEGPPLPMVALTDGPLLWPYAGRSQEEASLLHRLFAVLDGLRRLHAMPLGFIERPSGQPLVRMLWHLAGADEGAARPRVGDAALMETLLPPGGRTRWFLRRSAMQERYSREQQAIWFCYLNVGEEGRPIIVRVETPGWAATREGWVETMQRVLLHQSRLAGGHPYVLARAHELALVTMADKAALEQRLYRELAARGLRPHPSAKAQQKAMLGKR